MLIKRLQIAVRSTGRSRLFSAEEKAEHSVSQSVRKFAPSWPVFWLLLLALGVRLSYLPQKQVIESNAYPRIAQSLADGNGLLVWGETIYLRYPPAYPGLIAPLYILLGDAEFAGRLVSLTMSVATVFVTWRIARLILGQKAAIVAAALVAISAPLVEKSLDVMSEPTYMLLLMSCAYLSLRQLKYPSWGQAVALGLCFGLLYLTRQEGLFPAVGLISILFVSNLLSQERKIDGLRRSLITLILFSSILGAYVVHIHAMTGDWAISTKTHNNWYIAQMPDPLSYEELQYGLDEAGRVMGTDRFEPPRILASILADPGYFAARYLTNAFKEIKILFLAMNALVPFVIIGFVRLVRDPRYRAATLILLACLTPLALYPGFYMQVRNVDTVIPTLSLFAANGLLILVPLFSYLKRYRLRVSAAEIHAGSAILLFSSVFLLIPIATDLIRIPFPPQYIEHKEAGLWLKETRPWGSTAATVTMSRKPWVAFYGGTRHIGIPYANYDRIMLFAEQYGVDLLVIDEAFIPSRRPPLNFLLDMSQAPSYLKPIYASDQYTDGKIIVYQFLRSEFCMKVECRGPQQMEALRY